MEWLLMKNWNRPMKRLTAMVLAMLMLFSCISLADSAQVAERTPADYVFTDYGHSYHLVSFLNGYNVLAFGNAHSKLIIARFVGFVKVGNAGKCLGLCHGRSGDAPSSCAMCFPARATRRRCGAMPGATCREHVFSGREYPGCPR